MQVARIVTGTGTRKAAKTTAALAGVIRRGGATTLADDLGTPFFLTLGEYALWSGTRWIGERGASVFVLNAKREDATIFRASAIVLAEKVAMAFGRSEVVVQIQVAGIGRETIGVLP